MPKPSPYRITLHERSQGLVSTGSLDYGDVCILDGTLVMIVHPPQLENTSSTHVWLCNLMNGAVWATNGGDLVRPCTDVRLKYATTQRSGH